MREVKIVAGLAGLFLFATNAPGQATAKLEFEVASVRAAGPYQRPAGTPDIVAEMLSRNPTVRGGPGTDDPERLTIVRMPLRNLLWTAYGMRPDQISGPAWLDSELFDVSAKIAPGATKEQANEMLQNLLVERFKITLHHTTKDFPAHELSVAKNGSKVKEVAPDPNLSPLQPGEFMAGRTGLDANGFPVLPEGKAGLVVIPSNGLMRMTCRACSIAQLIQRFVEALAVPAGSTMPYLLGGRVINKTGLTGKYDFHLQYSSGPGAGGALRLPSLDDQTESGPDLFGALEKQLGLKLEKTKTPLDVLVIDRIDKIPTDN